MPSNSPTPDPQGKNHRGCLYVVATPIGNMDDITLRALNILGEVDLVAAEDTRHTGKLLARHHIEAALISYHEHNEHSRTPALISRLKNGETIALLTDAGTPSVSDPGYRLVESAVVNRIRVVPVPGASAAVTALSVSGLPTDAFVFAGFLPRRGAKRRRQLESLAAEEKTLIFFESPKRILRLLEAIGRTMGDRYGVLSREMTKLHEEFIRGPVSEIAGLLQQRPSIKGECTLVLSGAAGDDSPDPDVLEQDIRTALGQPAAKPSVISKQIAAKFGISKSRVYRQVLRIKKQLAG